MINNEKTCSSDMHIWKTLGIERDRVYRAPDCPHRNINFSWTPAHAVNSAPLLEIFPLREIHCIFGPWDQVADSAMARASIHVYLYKYRYPKCVPVYLFGTSCTENHR